MGYSCAKAAADTLETIQRLFGDGQSSNVFKSPDPDPYLKDKTYFHERGDETKDGAVIGAIYLTGPADVHIGFVGRFRIEPDGTIKKFPGIPHKYWAEIEAESKNNWMRRRIAVL